MDRDRVGHAARFVDAAKRGENLRRNFFVELHILIELREDRPSQGLNFRRAAARDLDQAVVTGKVRIIAVHGVDFSALNPFDQHLDRTVGQLEHLQNI